MAHENTIGVCLKGLSEGDASAWERLVPLVYDQLRAQAHAVFRGAQNTLQATEILHEALADLLDEDLNQLQFEGPGRFFALASRVMRNKLQDHIRRRNAEKRGGGRMKYPIESVPDELPAGLTGIDFLALHEILEQLREHDERLWLVTELKFFCGLTNREVAGALHIAVKTVESDWTFAKAWLQQQLGGANDTGAVQADTTTV